MNKRVLKEFAINARRELLKQIDLRAQAFGITSEGSPVLESGSDYVEVNGKKLPIAYKKGLEKLLQDIEAKGYDHVIEEVAYTWFNRLIAIRYMEVHNYLPSKVRVLSSETKGKVDPDILTEYQYTGLPVDQHEISSLLQQSKREEAYRKLLIAQCNELHEIMPFLFEKIADYTELLLPESLLHADSMIHKLGKELDDENFEHVEVIGWLYQYYISEKKDEVFAGLKKNKKITKENIPAATQLFTPHWIVRYMVENSLGHMWLESHPESNLKAEMNYYVEPAEQEPEVQAKLDELRNPNLSPEEITVMDPACGSGHILVYAFDLLYKIYEERGYPVREIPALILENNLYGIDIDDRAAQLAAFALLMKAREKTKRIFRNPPKLNIRSIQESNSLPIDQAADLIGENEAEVNELKTLFQTFIDAKNFGSILKPEKVDFDKYIQKIEQLKQTGQPDLETYQVFEQLDKLKEIIEQAKILASQYDVVVTNPPYMGSKGMNPQLKKLLEKNYTTGKSDLFAVFMLRANEFTKEKGFSAAINQHSWMFLSSFEKLRTQLIKNMLLHSMLHLGPRAFEDIGGEVVQSTSFVIRNVKMEGYNGSYIRLTDFSSAKEKETIFLNKRQEVSYTQKQASFLGIPGSPIAFWIREEYIKLFSTNSLKEFVDANEGLKTGDNQRFIRYWFEVDINDTNLKKKLNNVKWYKITKGGQFRKWYGNNEEILNYEDNGRELKDFKKSSITAESNYFKENVTWTRVTTSKISFRYTPEGSIPNMAGLALYSYKNLKVILGLLNSKVVKSILEIMNPTMNFPPGIVSSIPYKVVEKEYKTLIENLVNNNINISKEDWDSFETSWDFKRHPFLTYRGEAQRLEECFANWEEHAERQFRQLQKNEEELNRIFIELYGLEDELTPEVPDDEVTVRRADRVRDAKSFLSYCVGLMMGRYSLDAEGLQYAGGEWDESKYKTFKPDSDGIIPLTDTAYFEDDVISRLQELLILMFGQETLAENMHWLAESLEMKKNETPVERLRRYFFDEFYKDHCKIYQKRPIYWMAESGKKKGFRALFYLHRYRPETLATMRFTYVQNLQEKLREERKRLEHDLLNPDLSATMKKRYEKQVTKIKAQQEELIDFDKNLAELANQRIELDLDDGVVENYKKFASILAKI